jgi:hypothetical protein
MGMLHQLLFIMFVYISNFMFCAEAPQEIKREWGHIIDKDHNVLYWGQLKVHCNLHDLMAKYRELEKNNPGAMVLISTHRLEKASLPPAQTACDESRSRLGSFLRSLTNRSSSK